MHDSTLSSKLQEIYACSKFFIDLQNVEILMELRDLNLEQSCQCVLIGWFQSTQCWLVNGLSLLKLANRVENKSKEYLFCYISHAHLFLHVYQEIDRLSMVS